VSYYVIAIMKGILRCQIVDVIDAMKKEDVITINLLGLIEEVLAIILLDMIEVMLWAVEDSLLVENLVTLGSPGLGKTLDMIDHSKNSLRI